MSQQSESNAPTSYSEGGGVEDVDLTISESETEVFASFSSLSPSLLNDNANEEELVAPIIDKTNSTTLQADDNTSSTSDTAFEAPSTAEVGEMITTEAPSTAAETAKTVTTEAVTTEAPSTAEVAETVITEAPSTAEVAETVTTEAPSTAEVAETVTTEAPSTAEVAETVITEACSTAEVAETVVTTEENKKHEKNPASEPLAPPKPFILTGLIPKGFDCMRKLLAGSGGPSHQLGCSETAVPTSVENAGTGTSSGFFNSLDKRRMVTPPLQPVIDSFDVPKDSISMADLQHQFEEIRAQLGGVKDQVSYIEQRVLHVGDVVKDYQKKNELEFADLKKKKDQEILSLKKQIVELQKTNGGGGEEEPGLSIPEAAAADSAEPEMMTMTASGPSVIPDGNHGEAVVANKPGPAKLPRRRVIARRGTGLGDGAVVEAEVANCQPSSAQSSRRRVTRSISVKAASQNVEEIPEKGKVVPVAANDPGGPGPINHGPRARYVARRGPVLGDVAVAAAEAKAPSQEISRKRMTRSRSTIEKAGASHDDADAVGTETGDKVKWQRKSKREKNLPVPSTKQ